MVSAESDSSTPRRCDLAILTVIAVEREHMLKAFGLPEAKGKPVGQLLYWETSVYSENMQRELRVVIGNVAKAGLVAATLRTVRFLQDFQPKMLILAGIAAGWREKLRIGNIVWPRSILELAQSEEHSGKRKKFRPNHHNPPAEVQQMLQAWTVKPEDLAVQTERIYGGKPKPLIGCEAQFAEQMSVPPKAEDCVIACGDFLVRNPKMFKTFQNYDPQTRAFEMESAGMVHAINDFQRGTAWLQVRGISDFGDTDKSDIWQPYAAAAAAAFVYLFVTQGFDPDLLAGSGSEEGPTTPPVPTFVPPPISSLTVSSVSASTVTPSTSANPLIKEFDELSLVWRTRRDAKVLKKLQELCLRSDFREMAPDAQARILRYTAKIMLEWDEDAPAAQQFADRAEALAGPSRVLQALLLAAKSEPLKGAEYLQSPTTIEEWNQRMAFLLQAGNSDAIIEQWQTPPEGVGPDTESRRLYVLALLTKKRVADAGTEFAKIGPKHPEILAIRFVGAVLDYFQAISSAAPDPAFRLSPYPIPVEFVKRDNASLAALDRAARSFAEIMKDLPPGTNLYSELRLWRLAALANHATHRAEAEALCSEILSGTPTDVRALAWASARNYDVDKDAGMIALADKLNVTL